MRVPVLESSDLSSAFTLRFCASTGVSHTPRWGLEPKYTVLGALAVQEPGVLLLSSLCAYCHVNQSSSFTTGTLLRGVFP